MDQTSFQAAVEQAHTTMQQLRNQVARVVVGQQTIVDRLLIALLIRGHVLIEGLPGMAKTLLVRTLAATIDASFKRIQFTPDLLPADSTGTLIFDPAGRVFNARFGPVFANLVLGDEINRAPAKVQAALLEAMQERQVTIGDSTYPLPDPFIVIATQNPIEHEGTYPLPEAQVDRFVMKLSVGYPPSADEETILSRFLNPVAEPPVVQKVIELTEISRIAQLAGSIYVDEKIVRYIVQIVQATRTPAAVRLGHLAPYLTYGASPRASLAIAHVAKGHAFLQRRGFVIPEDVKAIAADVLRHRLVMSYEAAAEQITPESIIEQVLSAVPVP